MTTSEEKRRVLIALTEKGPLPGIWQTLRKMLEGVADSEIVAVFVADDRWHRAASLPCTREVLLISGATREFTPQRAQEIVHEAAGRTRTELESLAAEAGFRFSFEILLAGDQSGLERLVSGARNLVIAPSELAGSPVHAIFERLSCEIVLVEA